MSASVAKSLCVTLGGLLLVLGAATWGGLGIGVARAHVIVGVLFSIVLATMAVVLAARRQPQRGYALLTLTAVMAVFGIAHGGIVPGPHHSIVRVIHLLVGAAVTGVSFRYASRLDQCMEASR